MSYDRDYRGGYGAPSSSSRGGYDDRYYDDRRGASYDDRYARDAYRSAPPRDDRYGRRPPAMGARSRLYVSNIGRCGVRDLEDLFGKYGRIIDIALKTGFAFVEFEDERDALDAVRGRDGYELEPGVRLRVEPSKPRGGPAGPAFGAPGFGGPGAQGPPKCFNCGEHGHIARDCTNGDWSNRCYTCKQEGHKSNQCPNRAGPGPAAAAPSNDRRSRSRSPRRDRSRSRSPRRSRSRSPRRSSRSRSPRRSSPSPRRHHSRSRSRSRARNEDGPSGEQSAPAVEQAAPAAEAQSSEAPQE